MFVALDFETADFKADSACAVGMARIEEGEVTGTFYRLIRPPRSRVMFTHIHGLTWPTLSKEIGFAELWPEMAAFMQDATGFIAHNASFDRRILQGCCAAFGLEAPALPFYCTLKGARRNLGLASNSLGAVCAHLDIDLHHHHAGSDALGAAHIFLHLTRGAAKPLPLDQLRLR